MAEPATVRSIYRHLLRNVGHAVRHSKPTVKNLRRLLREDVESSLRAQPSAERLEEQAANTFLLYLSSMRSSAAIRTSDDPPLSPTSQPPRLAAPPHHVMLNLASLCYHHLSPNTVMQPNLRSRRQGGSDSRQMRRRRSRRMAMRGALALLRRRGGQMDDDDDDDDGNDGLDAHQGNSGQILPSLYVPASRPRGPRPGSSDSRMLSIARWDPQSAHKPSSSLTDEIAAKQAKIDATAEQMYSARQAALHGTKEDEKRAEVLLRRLREERGLMKVLRRTKAAAELREKLSTAGAPILAPIVERAQARTGAWMGAARFGMWKRGEWLPP